MGKHRFRAFWYQVNTKYTSISQLVYLVFKPPNLLTLHSARGPEGSHKFCVSGQIEGEELRVRQASEASRGHSAESGYET